MTTPQTLVVRTFTDRAEGLSHFVLRAGEAPRLLAFDDALGCPVETALAALEWTGAVGVLQDDDLLHAARLTSETAAAVIERKGQDGRRYVYLGPRLDAPPMDVFEGAILFDEPGVKAVEFTQRAHGLAHFLRATAGAGALLALLGRRAPGDPPPAPLAGRDHSGAGSPPSAGRRLVRGQLGRLSLLLAGGRADLSLHRGRYRIMIRCCLPLLVSLWATTLAAQGTVVAPEPVLDARRATLRDQLLQFRDTLNTIDAAAARLQRDYREASAAALSSRARVMTDACARSARNVGPARQAITAAPASSERQVKSRTELLEELDRLHAGLGPLQNRLRRAQPPRESEKVRGYANDRAVRVQSALRRYETSLGSFFSAMGIKVSPLGAKPGQAA